MTKQRYVRVGDTLDDETMVVVRGGDLDTEVLVADAERMFGVYGSYGISVFALRDVGLHELAQQSPLVRLTRLTLMTVGAVRQAGLDLEPTGRNTRHFTVRFEDLTAGIAALQNCEHRTFENPYYEE